MPGDVFGLELDEERHFSAEAVNNAVILALKRKAIMRLAACDADFARQLWAVTAQECQRAQNHIVILGCLNTRQRVAAFLLLMALRSSGDSEIELSMTRRPPFHGAHPKRSFVGVGRTCGAGARGRSKRNEDAPHVK
jgi:CRP/FNR family nitrogen fixation transcriptional regulator